MELSMSPRSLPWVDDDKTKVGLEQVGIREPNSFLSTKTDVPKISVRE